MFFSRTSCAHCVRSARAKAASSSGVEGSATPACWRNTACVVSCRMPVRTASFSLAMMAGGVRAGA